MARTASAIARSYHELLDLNFPLHFDKKSPILISKRKGIIPEDKLDLPQGTLDLLILKAVALEPLHG